MKIVMPLFICFLLACENSIKSKLDLTKNDEKLIFQKSQILGKSIDTKRILGDSIKINGRSLLVYTGYDCGSCVTAAFQLVNKADSIKKEGYFIVIEIQSNKGRDQMTYNYSNYIFSDTEDLIRKQLKYIKTPFAAHFDSHGKITSVIFPDITSKIDDDLLREFSNLN